MSERTMSWSLLLLICSPLISGEPDSVPCDHPGSPDHAMVKISGAVAFYRCQSGYHLLGSPTRTCEDGRWNPAMPLCGADVAGGKPAFLSTESRNETVEFATDWDREGGGGQSDLTCTETEMERVPWLIIDLLAPYHIYGVNLTKLGYLQIHYPSDANSNGEEGARYMNIELLIGNSTRKFQDNTPCVKFHRLGREETLSLEGSCSEPIVGQYAILRAWTTPMMELIKLGVCKMQLFSTTTIHSSQCPHHAPHYLDGLCFGLFPPKGDEDGKTWEESKKACSAQGGELSWVLESPRREFLAWQITNDHYGQDFWSDLQQISQQDEWTRTLHEKEKFEPTWFEEEELNSTSVEWPLCAAVSGEKPRFQLKAPCNQRKGWICQFHASWCGLPGIPEGVKTYQPLRKTYAPGDIVSYYCEGDEAYISKKCLQSGRWSDPSKECQTNRRSEEPVDSTVSSEVHDDTSEDTLVSPTSPTSDMTQPVGPVPDLCPQPEPPEEGMVELVKEGEAVWAVFTCQKGATLQGSARIPCIHGEWTDATPICEKAQCPTPPTIRNGQFLLSPNSTEAGTRLLYSCRSGFTLQGASNLRCLETGIWDGPWPKCTRLKAHCRDIEVENGDVLYLDGDREDGGRALVSCHPGHSLSPAHSYPILRCLPDGFWNATPPKCYLGIGVGAVVDSRMPGTGTLEDTGPSNENREDPNWMMLVTGIAAVALFIIMVGFLTGIILSRKRKKDRTCVAGASPFYTTPGSPLALSSHPATSVSLYASLSPPPDSSASGRPTHSPDNDSRQLIYQEQHSHRVAFSPTPHAQDYSQKSSHFPPKSGSIQKFNSLQYRVRPAEDGVNPRTIVWGSPSPHPTSQPTIKASTIDRLYSIHKKQNGSPKPPSRSSSRARSTLERARKKKAARLLLSSESESVRDESSAASDTSEETLTRQDLRPEPVSHELSNRDNVRIRPVSHRVEEMRAEALAPREVRFDMSRNSEMDNHEIPLPSSSEDYSPPQSPSPRLFVPNTDHNAERRTSSDSNATTITINDDSEEHHPVAPLRRNSSKNDFKRPIQHSNRMSREETSDSSSHPWEHGSRKAPPFELHRDRSEREEEAGRKAEMEKSEHSVRDLQNEILNSPLFLKLQQAVSVDPSRVGRPMDSTTDEGLPNDPDHSVAQRNFQLARQDEPRYLPSKDRDPTNNLSLHPRQQAAPENLNLSNDYRENDMAGKADFTPDVRLRRPKSPPQVFPKPKTSSNHLQIPQTPQRLRRVGDDATREHVVPTQRSGREREFNSDSEYQRGQHFHDESPENSRRVHRYPDGERFDLQVSTSLPRVNLIRDKRRSLPEEKTRSLERKSRGLSLSLAPQQELFLPSSYRSHPPSQSEDEYSDRSRQPSRRFLEDSPPSGGPKYNSSARRSMRRSESAGAQSQIESSSSKPHQLAGWPGVEGNVLLDDRALKVLLETESFEMDGNFVERVELKGYGRKGSKKNSTPSEPSANRGKSMLGVRRPPKPTPRNSLSSTLSSDYEDNKPRQPRNYNSSKNQHNQDLSVWDAKKFKNRHKRVQFKDSVDEFEEVSPESSLEFS